MGKICLITDTHTGTRGDSLVFHKQAEKFFDFFFDTMEAENIKDIIHLGDIFDRKKHTNSHTLFLSRKYLFDRLNAYNVHAILGNHDCFFTDTNSVNSPTLLLQEYKNINIIQTPTELEFDNIRMLLVPWMNNNNIAEFTNKIKETTCEYVGGHFDIIGFEMHAGTFSKHGLDAGLFKRFEKTFSGHYHKPSNIDNIFYLGSPYEMTWADYGERRGFYLLDTISGELELVLNPYNTFYKIFFNETISKNIDVTKYTDGIIRLYCDSNTIEVEDLKNRLEKVCSSVTVIENKVSVSETIEKTDITVVGSNLDIILSIIDSTSDIKNPDYIKNKVLELYNRANEVACI